MFSQRELSGCFSQPSDGQLLLTIRDYVPEQGVLRLYDALGGGPPPTGVLWLE